MLNELKNLDFHGGKEGLLFFLCDVIGNGKIKIHDAEIICSHAAGKRYLSVNSLIKYSLAFDWIQESDDMIFVSSYLLPLIEDKQKLNDALVKSTIDKLFEEGIFNLSLFSYDAVQRCFAFKNECLPLPWASLRNVLISQGFLLPQHDCQGTKFYIASSYDSIIAKHCKIRQKQLTLEKLKRQLENQEIAGEKAEQYVLAFEKARIGQPLCESITRISEIDVAAGYDIVSFDSNQSQELNRFIEVKAVSSTGFFWSKNEYEIAKLKGETYYL